MSNSDKAKPTSNQGNGGNWPTKNGSSNSSYECSIPSFKSAKLHASNGTFYLSKLPKLITKRSAWVVNSG